MKNREANSIRESGRNISILSIILGIIAFFISAVFSRGFDFWGPLSIIGFGQLVYFFARGFSEIIELLHHIAMALGTVDPENNRSRSILGNSSIIDYIYKILQTKEATPPPFI